VGFICQSEIGLVASIPLLNHKHTTLSVV